jgi:hypothetical protein
MMMIEQIDDGQLLFLIVYLNGPVNKKFPIFITIILSPLQTTEQLSWRKKHSF